MCDRKGWDRGGGAVGLGGGTLFASHMEMRTHARVQEGQWCIVGQERETPGGLSWNKKKEKIFKRIMSI